MLKKSETYERLIKQWALSHVGGDSGESPTGECISFAQAESLAENQPVLQEIKDHIESCSRCKRLIELFAEAKREQAAEMFTSKSNKSIFIRSRRIIAAAASVLIIIAAYIYISPSTDQGEFVGSYRVGLTEDIAQGLIGKSQAAFKVGDSISFRVELKELVWIAIANIDNKGNVVFLPPDSNQPKMLHKKFSTGNAIIGQYRLTGPAGTERFCLLISTRPIDITAIKSSRENIDELDSHDMKVLGFELQVSPKE